MDFLRVHQLDIMLFLSGVCGILILMTITARFLSRERKCILTIMELAAMLVLLFDRWSYLYRGDASDFGYVMVRISNGMVFLMMILIPLLVTNYMRDLYRHEGGMDILPKRLLICDILFFIGAVLLLLSQFTGLYYTFDAQNNYQRASGFIFSYIIPFLIVVIQESVILKYREKLDRRFEYALALSIGVPTVASVIQIFTYGVSLITMSMVIVVILFFVYALSSLSDEVEQARIREVEQYKEAQQREYALFVQTTEALANAIDAKDRYTHGHSTRVADLSRIIAEEAGLSEEDCSHVYFAALLHDVGKIGVRDDIINKPGKLTEEEFAHVKTHTVLGYQILSNIKQSPYLSDGAHYHHERVDGRGYPDGLTGQEIPEIARIIAVADAYDAMTSTRSYRSSLDAQKVRKEIERGKGSQFDSRFAEILLQLIDHGDVGPSPR